MKPSRELQHLARELSLACGLPTAWPARDVPGSVDFGRVRSLVEKNQLLPFCVSRGRESALGFPGGGVTDFDLAMSYYQSGRQAALRLAVLHQVREILNGQVEMVVLKGMAVAPLLYRELAERPMRDMDLLFQAPAERERARDLLEQAGFSSMRTAAAHHHLPPVVDPAGRVSIELHDNLMTPPLPRDFMAELWRHRVAGSDSPACPTLDAAGLFVHHALHALNDPVDSPLLRDLFEVATLGMRLNQGQHERVRELAARSGAAAVIATAVHLAHGLFGSPDFLSAPPRGPYEAWCARCLEWVPPFTAWRRFQRHAARERFNRLCEHPDERNPWPWAGKCIAGVAHRVVRHVGRLGHWGPARYRRADYHFVHVGENTLIHDASTREVHMLNADATRLWNAAVQAQSRSRLLAELLPYHSPAEARMAFSEMTKKGLIIPCR